MKEYGLSVSQSVVFLTTCISIAGHASKNHSRATESESLRNGTQEPVF